MAIVVGSSVAQSGTGTGTSGGTGTGGTGTGGTGGTGTGAGTGTGTGATVKVLETISGTLVERDLYTPKTLTGLQNVLFRYFH